MVPNFIDLEAIAQRLIHIQQESGMNAKDFCEETGISNSTYSQIKGGSGKINVETINKVVQRWGEQFPPMWFIFGEAQAQDTANPSILGIEGGDENNQVHQALLQSMEEIGRLKELLHQAKPKEIERITVFYTDNSFANYKLID